MRYHTDQKAKSCVFTQLQLVEKFDLVCEADFLNRFATSKTILSAPVFHINYDIFTTDVAVAARMTLTKL